MQSAQPLSGPLPPGANRAAAWLVHLYTASGALAAYFAAVAAIGGRDREAFLWLALAAALDATDGTLARAADVRRVLPSFDGARLDDIVDYLTFVFVPVLLLHLSGSLPAGWGGAVAAAVLLSSAYGFASTDAKTDDHFFTGFPSYWNIVALYLYAAGFAPAVNAVILLGLSAMVFVRTAYVYPSKTPVLRGLTIALGWIWGVLMVAVILTLPEVPRALLAASLVFPVYYTVLSFVLAARRARRPVRA